MIKGRYGPLAERVRMTHNTAMNSLIALALLLAPANLSSVQIDPEVLAEQSAIDAEILSSLRASGDDPGAMRAVSVRFEGTAEAIGTLEADAAELGWTVVQTAPLEDGSVALDLQREQTAEDETIQELTETALRIEAAYGVLYNGWGMAANPLAAAQ